MASELVLAVSAAGGIGTVIGWLGKHFTNGKVHRGEDIAAEAEFRGEIRQVLKPLADTQSKAVDLMGDVHQEIAHTNAVLAVIEERGRGSDEAIRKILGR